MKTISSLVMTVIFLVLSLSATADPPKTIRGRIINPNLSQLPGQSMLIHDVDNKKYYHVQPMGVDHFYPPKSLHREAFNTVFPEISAWLSSLTLTAVVVTDVQVSPYISEGGVMGPHPVYRGVVSFDNSSRTKKDVRFAESKANINGKKTLAEAAISLGFGRVHKEDSVSPSLRNLPQLEAEARKAGMGWWKLHTTDELVAEAEKTRDASVESSKRLYEVSRMGKKEKSTPRQERRE